MDLTKLLNPAATRVAAAMTSKKRLFHDLGEIAHAVYGMPGADAVDALIDRENLGPTGVGGGVALPHARMTGIDRVHGIFLKLDKPMDFASVDRQPVDLIFALFAPESAGVEHLKALAVVSRTMRNADLCAKLRANDDPATLHTLLTAGHATQAA